MAKYANSYLSINPINLDSLTLDFERFLLHAFTFTTQGLPTHDASGEEIAKAQVKKLQKLYAAQEKKYNEYVKSKSNEQ